jgi:D-alanyl-D-alanine carboxypeptidase (penicillin-binding protein 5/6)
LFLLLAVAGLLFNYFRPLPHANASINSFDNAAEKVQLKWPAYGSAAIGAAGYGTLETHGPQQQRPMASIAKIVTALAVLEKHPLKKGQQGPEITMNDADLALFNKYFREGGAYVKVESGEKITQYQALQAILLPSANNMADSLAIWAFGSIDNYLVHANKMLQRLGLKDTVVGTDASGFTPSSISTPADLITLGGHALQNPVIAEIVRQPSAVIPVHGVIYSANSRLGFNNIIGIKTGLTDEAGGCFLFAAEYKNKNGKSATIIGAVMGSPNLRDALLASEPLLNSAKPYFAIKTPVKAGEVFATLTTPWLETAEVIAKTDITLLVWKGATLVPHIELAAINRSLPAGSQVGTAIVASGGNKATTPLVLQKPINGPTWQWRLKRF